MAHVGKAYIANTVVVYIQGSVRHQRMFNKLYPMPTQKKLVPTKYGCMRSHLHTEIHIIE